MHVRFISVTELANIEFCMVHHIQCLYLTFTSSLLQPLALGYRFTAHSLPSCLIQFAVQFDVDYFSWRFWIGLWTMLFLILFAVGEVSILIKFFTRFSEEIFTLVVAGFFALQCVFQLYKVL